MGRSAKDVRFGMRRLIPGLIVALCTLENAAAQDQPGSYLVQHELTPEGRSASRTIPYEPHAGDLVFFNDYKAHWVFLYKMVGSEGPYHAALIYRKANGEYATVEAGPNDTLTCRVLPLVPRLQEFPGTVQIRRVKTPLAPDQEAALARWAESQDGKRYALGRLLLQATPVRCRGPLRKEWFGATYTNRSAYLCAELAVAGGTTVGLFDPAKQPGNAIYPRDIIFNDKYDISATYHDADLWSAYPLK
jgi:hypothetical protein